MPDDILNSYEPFPQPTRSQPSVEYLPIPRTLRPPLIMLGGAVDPIADRPV